MPDTLTIFSSVTHICRDINFGWIIQYWCQRYIHILYLPVPPCRPRYLLWLLYLLRDMKHWHSIIIHSNSNHLYRLRFTMRPNIILRSNCNYQPPICNSLHRHWPCPMDLKKFTDTYINWRATSWAPIYYYRSTGIIPLFPINPSSHANLQLNWEWTTEMKVLVV